MKMTSLQFILPYLANAADIEERLYSCITENGKQATQPRKWRSSLPPLPEALAVSQEHDETVWILIPYVGAFSVISLLPSQVPDGSVIPLPKGTQRAIQVHMNYSKGVTWKLYQNTVDDVHYRDVHNGIRTFKVC